MAKPFQVIQTGGLRQSNLGIGVDAAMRALDVWAQKKQGNEAVEKLVPYINSLDKKSQVAFLGKLASEDQNLFRQVAARVSPAGEDPMEKFERDLAFLQTGYNPNTSAPPLRAAPEPAPLGPLGLAGLMGTNASMPAPYDPNVPQAPVGPGFGSLPSNAGEAALMQSARNFSFGGGPYASAAGIVGQTNMASLPDGEQLGALRVATKTAPEANVVTRETGQNSRNERTVSATLHGQKSAERIAKIRVDEDREERLSRKDGDPVVARQDRAADRQERQAAINRLEDQIWQNEKDLRTERGKVIPKLVPLNVEAVNAINDHTAALKVQLACLLYTSPSPRDS